MLFYPFLFYIYVYSTYYNADSFKNRIALLSNTLAFLKRQQNASPYDNTSHLCFQ